MAKIERFILRNFKGAQEVKIDIFDGDEIPVTTLLGLNESGKTTILEGISNFVTEDDSTKSLFKLGPARDNPTQYIPKHRSLYTCVTH